MKKKKKKLGGLIKHFHKDFTSHQYAPKRFCEPFKTPLIPPDYILFYSHLQGPYKRCLLGKLRSYEIITENYSCARHKNRPKHSQHFQLLFQNKLILWYIKVNIYTLKT